MPGPPGGQRPGGGAPRAAAAAEVRSAEDTAQHNIDIAQRYVEMVLDGGLGELRRQAAESAVTLATERGFDDDPQRVAEAIRVLLHPSRR